MEMKVLVCGGRKFDNPNLLFATLEEVHHGRGPIELIIEGGAKGADSFAREWADVFDIPVDTYPADWKKHGKAAGPIRNRHMLQLGQPDLVIAAPGGRGTANCVEQAKKLGVEVLEINDAA